MGLQKGLYGVRFTASDQLGAFSCDTVWIAVDTLISFPVILAQLRLFGVSMQVAIILFWK
jgi:hypothetical protein